MKPTLDLLSHRDCRSVMRMAMTLIFSLFAFVGLIGATSVSPEGLARTVKGKVTDENNQPLSYVTVKVKSSDRGTFTDLAGNFQVDAEANDVLEFSYLGYETQEVTVGASNELYITLKPVNAQLDQVVIVAYGTQKKRAVTGAISSVKGEQLAKQPLLTAAQGLQGLAPGIQVVGSSQPGTQPRVTIRGLNTLLTNENPLYVVDGTPTDDITNINTLDIVSVDVLKDGSAAMYGSRSSNGVILITTRKGQSGKPNVSLDTYMGFRRVNNLVKMADRQQYLDYTNEARAYDGIDPLETLDNSANTDWYDEITRNGLVSNTNFNINGGSDAFTYLFSAGYLKDESVLVGADYDRFTIRSNNEYHLSKRINLGNTLTVSLVDSENKPSGVFTDAYRASPAAPVFQADGSYGYQPGLSAAGNPLANLELTNDHGRSTRMQGSLYGDVRLLKGLTFRSNLGFDRVNFGQRTYDPVYNFGTFTKAVSELRRTEGFKNYWIWSNTVNWNTKIGKDHGFDITAGMSAEQTKGQDNQLRIADVPNQENLWYISKGDPSSLSLLRDNGFLVQQNSYFGRLTYSLMDKYNLSGVVRKDGSSAFPRGQKYGDFYSVGASWIVSDEAFFKNDLFQTLKLRVGYAKLGNDAISAKVLYNAPLLTVLNQYVPDPKNLIDNELSALLSVTNTSPYAFPNALVDGITFDEVRDVAATWETTKSFDAGVEFGMFDNKLQGEISYYNKLTNAYIRVPTPSFVDKNGILSQAADVRNKGLEVALNYRKLQNDNFSWRFGVNGTFNQNSIEAIRGGINLKEGGLGNGEVTTSSVEGQPIGSFWVYEVAGIFQTQAEIDAAPHVTGTLPGDFRYTDVNNDNVIDERDRVFKGSYQPKFYYGINAGFNFKALDFSVDCYGNAGNKVYNGKKAVRFGNENVEAARVDRWKSGSGINDEYRASNAIPKPSDYFVESGDFFRINNITLGYTLPSSATRKAKIENTRIYISAQNPVIAKKFSGFSPELPGSNALNSGIELSVYPTTATYLIGLHFNFN